MPYTPPTKSPTTSRPETPDPSRPSSYNSCQPQVTAGPSHGSRTGLPHSSSRAYLNKHRRSPPVIKQSDLLTPDSTPQDNRSPDSDDQKSKESSATGARQSPTDSPAISLEPSPPVSPQTSSDDDASTARGRGRDIAKLAELQAAIRIIEQHRAGSPDPQGSEATKKARLTLGLPLRQTDPSNKEQPSKPVLSPGLRLSAEARKISHSRSTTDTSAFFDFPRNKFDSPARSQSESDGEDEDDELVIKPSLIRKKSGELVRPALRPSSMRRRPSSMPGTPTYSKAVHFQDNSLEHVRHFLQVDRPIAVSAGSSPVDPYDEESDFPFGDDESSARPPPYEWEIRVTNFPQVSVERRALPVRTERVYLSPDTKILEGDVVVRNLAFHKLVVARFTLDYWKTTSEIVAEYNNDVRKKQAAPDSDIFTFRIKLEDQANLENKTMFFCIRYSVNGQDYWDNNNSVNYQVDFSKKLKPQNGKQSTQAKTPRPLNVLPRSKPSATFSSPRPRSMPSFDDFAGSVNPYEFSSFPQPSTLVGDSPIRFKNKPSARDIVPDAPPGRSKASANGQAFGNRYDFGASLSAAIQAAGTSLGDRGEGPSKNDTKSTSGKESGNPPVIQVQPSPDATKTVKANESSQEKVTDPSKPVALTSEKPSLQSQSYHELLDKYCFFGSAKPSARPAKSEPLRVDGASDDLPGPEKDSGKSLGSAGPSVPENRSPPLVEGKSSKISSPQSSRSSSPGTVSAIGSRTGSPASFRYPFHPSMQSGLFDTHTPTAIRG